MLPASCFRKPVLRITLAPGQETFAFTVAEQPFRILCSLLTERFLRCDVYLSSIEEEEMNKFGYIIAALAAIAIAAPSVASAETVIIKKRGYHHHGDFRDHRFGPRAEFRGHDRGWHRGHRHHNKVVIIKKQRRDY
jgi:hypothetical protein